MKRKGVSVAKEKERVKIKRNQQAKKKMIIIVGATASGKTSLAEEIKKNWNAEIINADVAQMYCKYQVGTAKPVDQDRGLLFDIMNKPENFDIKKYRNKVSKIIKTLEKDEKIAIVVGGSFFYIKHLLFSIPGEPRGKVCNKIEESIVNAVIPEHYQDLSAENMFDILSKLDGKRAEKIGPSDKYRLGRALEIIKKWKILPSSIKSNFFPIANRILIIAIMPKKEYLDERIEKRLTQMLGDCGGAWLEEVKTLSGTPWQKFAEKKGFLGYKELFEWGNAGFPQEDFPQVKQKILMETKCYAKRQVCFWRGLRKQLLENIGEFPVKIIEVEKTDEITPEVLRYVGLGKEKKG